MAKKMKTTETVDTKVQEEIIESQEIVESTKPTQDDIDRFKGEFETQVEAFRNITFNIVEKEELNILDAAKFLLDYNANKVTWSKDLWQGIIKFNEFIKDQIKQIENNGQKDIQFTYQPLEYIYFVLSNPSGIGLASALEFEENIGIFAEIYDQLENQVLTSRQMLQEIELAQQHWAAAEQGFFLEVEREDDPYQGDPCSDCEEIESDKSGLMIPTAEGEIGFIED